MRCEVVAIGTELLLGQIIDSNSAWIGDRLAEAGIDSHFQTKVGDNHQRIVLAIRTGLARSGAVICCGGLGPTQDDITREAIASVMNVGLSRDAEMVASIRAIFEARGREMAASNEQQADLPEGATFIPQRRGTAPGLICPVGHKVIYAVPGVPHEMQEMLERAVLPDLMERAGTVSTIRSRVLKTWGLSESRLAEIVAPRFDALAASGDATIAFLASGINGIKVRVTVKASSTAEASARLDEEETSLRALLGDVVFGTDDETMESVIGDLLLGAGLQLGVAESLTGGLVGSRLTEVPGSSGWFRGSIVSYASSVKFSLLGVPPGPVVSGAAAAAMAEGAARVLESDVALAVTGVAGPAGQDDQPVGTVFCAVHLDGSTSVTELHLPGDRDRIRQYATISLFDLLRRRLLDRAVNAGAGGAIATGVGVADPAAS